MKPGQRPGEPMTPEQHARLMELFDRACELDTGAREALLDELRREDGALAERLANMLAADAARSPVL